MNAKELIDLVEYDAKSVAYTSWAKSGERSSFTSIARGATPEEVEKKAMDVINSDNWKDWEKPPYFIRITKGARQTVVKEYEVGKESNTENKCKYCGKETAGEDRCLHCGRMRNEALDREFEVSLRSGDQNVNKTKKVYRTQSAADAAKKFMADFFPNEKLYLPLRPEQPEKSGDSVVTVWSAGTTASGQRVWVRGL